jgi:hypothetical protein
VKENTEFLRIILFVEMKISKLINYSTDICRSCQATTAILFCVRR